MEKERRGAVPRRAQSTLSQGKQGSRRPLLCGASHSQTRGGAAAASMHTSIPKMESRLKRRGAQKKVCGARNRTLQSAHAFLIGGRDGRGPAVRRLARHGSSTRGHHPSPSSIPSQKLTCFPSGESKGNSSSLQSFSKGRIRSQSAPSTSNGEGESKRVRRTARERAGFGALAGPLFSLHLGHDGVLGQRWRHALRDVHGRGHARDAGDGLPVGEGDGEGDGGGGGGLAL